MISITATMQTATAELKDDTLKQMVKYMDEQHIEFERGALLVHRKTVFEILIQMIRITPVVSGRLRGSWTPYMDRWGKQSAYARYLNDTTLVRSKPRTLAGQLGRAFRRALNTGNEISQGKAQGFFMDNGLLTTVGTNVVYASKVNDSSHYFDQGARAAEEILQENMQNYLEAARKAGWIPTDLSDDPHPR